MGANLAGALTGHKMKRPEQDTFAVREQPDFRTIDIDSFHLWLQSRLAEHRDGILHELHFRQ